MQRNVDIRVRLSLLWIVLMINMIFNDIFSIMVQLVDGGPIAIPGEVTVVMAIAAVLTNIPIFMILLSRILARRLNRILNIAAGLFTILYVVGGGEATPHYIVIAAIETVLALVIIVSAWRWKQDDSTVHSGRGERA